MRVIILGCGASLGVPLVGCRCAVCLSVKAENKRLRTSVVVKANGGVPLLIDTSPDLRQQMLRSGINDLYDVLYTHVHSDHCHGIDDLRAIHIVRSHGINVYAMADHLAMLTNKFGHSFVDTNQRVGFITKNPITPYMAFKAGAYDIEPYMQQHGYTYSIGYKIGRIAYSTDVSHLPDDSIAVLRDKIDIFIVGCVRYGDPGAHANLDVCMAWREAIRPKLTVLTHMSHEIEYNDISTRVPPSVVAAYDGLVIEYDVATRDITFEQYM